MQHWLTTHWPNLRLRPHQPAIYIQAGNVSKYTMKPGDQVLIYEFKNGPTVIDPVTGNRLFRAPGAEAIIAAIEIVGPLAQRPASAALESYVGRPSINWKWQAMTKLVATGKVPRVDVNKVLGYATKYNFHGFGPNACGFQVIPLPKFAALRARLH